MTIEDGVSVEVNRKNILIAMAELNSHAPGTWQIRCQMGMKDSVAVRRELLKMEKEGFVKRYLPWCEPNCIRWQAV